MFIVFCPFLAFISAHKNKIKNPVFMAENKLSAREKKNKEKNIFLGGLYFLLLALYLPGGRSIINAQLNHAVAKRHKATMNINDAFHLFPAVWLPGCRFQIMRFYFK